LREAVKQSHREVKFLINGEIKLNTPIKILNIKELKIHFPHLTEITENGLIIDNS